MVIWMCFVQCMVPFVLLCFCLYVLLYDNANLYSYFPFVSYHYFVFLCLSIKSFLPYVCHPFCVVSLLRFLSFACDSLPSWFLWAPLQPVMPSVCAQHRAMPPHHGSLWVPGRLLRLTLQPRQVALIAFPSVSLLSLSIFLSSTPMDPLRSLEASSACREVRERSIVTSLSDYLYYNYSIVQMETHYNRIHTPRHPFLMIMCQKYTVSAKLLTHYCCFNTIYSSGGFFAHLSGANVGVFPASWRNCHLQ